MKLPRHAFLRLWSVHAWTGVIAGLVLYVMFLAGGITLFHAQLEAWEEPLAQTEPMQGETQQAALDRALVAQGNTPDDFWFYPSTRGLGTARIAHLDRERESWSVAWVDNNSGKLVPQREHLAHFLYSLHFLWHELTGRWLYTCAGLLAVAFLLVLVTGVTIHFKDLVRQFHQFRPDKVRRIMWSDMHKVLGVMGLPFQLMYAYTGAFLVLGPWLLSAFTGPVFKGDHARAGFVAWGVQEIPAAPAGALERVWSLDALAARAVSARPGLEIQGYRLIHHGRYNGLVEVWGENSAIPRQRVVVQIREREAAVAERASTETAAAASGWMRGLHVAAFGGVWLRVLFLLLTLASCATILTGNWIWLARSAAYYGPVARWGLLSRLTVGIGAGSWVALAALFCASRALPFTWAVRGAVEELIFSSTLVACTLWALLARDEHGLWWRQLALAALLLFPVPWLAARHSRAGLFGSEPRCAAIVGVDVGLLLTALVLAASAWLLRRSWLRRIRTHASSVEPVKREIAGERMLVHARGSDARV